MADENDDLKKPEGGGDVPPANPPVVEVENATFMGQTVDLLKDDGTARTKAEITEQLERIVEKELAVAAGDEVVAEHPEIIERRVSAVNTSADIFAAEAVSRAERGGGGGDGNVIDLNLDQETLSGLTMREAGVEKPIGSQPEPEPEPEVTKAGDVEKPENKPGPENEHGDEPDPEPDPFYESIIEMPSKNENGADAYWKLLDAGSDNISEFADAIKDALADEAWHHKRQGFPSPPLWKGDFIAGYDKNDKLYMVFLTTVTSAGLKNEEDDGLQTDLANLRDSIGSITVPIGDFGFDPDTGAELEILVIPIYNEAAGASGPSCSENDDGTFSPSGEIMGSTPTLVGLWEIASGDDIYHLRLNGNPAVDTFLGCMVILPESNDCCDSS